jgi:ABC-type microcin C transport system permease subunit YejB
MKAFLARRLVFLLFVTFAVSTLVFFFIHMIPGDPVEIMLGESAQPADKAALRAALGLDRPLAEQYVRFLQGLVHGDLGASIRYHAPVTETILAPPGDGGAAGAAILRDPHRDPRRRPLRRAPLDRLITRRCSVTWAS